MYVNLLTLSHVTKDHIMYINCPVYLIFNKRLSSEQVNQIIAYWETYITEHQEELNAQYQEIDAEYERRIQELTSHAQQNPD